METACASKAIAHRALPQYLRAIPYSSYKTAVPTEGNHIVASYDEEKVVVYQAYRPDIAAAAVKNQHLACEGSAFKLTRMSWIKTNFLWMMYRSGWAQKKNQERILAIRLKRENFEEILDDAVVALFKEATHYANNDQGQWKKDLSNSCTRLQWDPDHTPNGGKTTRRAIQLGMKGEMLRKFASEWEVEIDDITDFVKEQRKYMEARDFEELHVIYEEKLDLNNPDLERKIALR